MLTRRLVRCGSLLLCVAGTFGCSPDDESGAGGEDSAPQAAGIVIETPAAGELAGVDTSKTLDIMRRLNDPASKDAAVEEITRDPSPFAPPALYVLASVMFSDGKKDDAVFWYHLGQLRARSDANKCNDTTAGEAIAVLRMEHGQPINEYAFQDEERLRRLLSKVLEFDRAHPRGYDPRWIALHGMGAFIGNSKPFAPQSKWKEIDESTRKDYTKDLDEALADFAKIMARIDTDGDGVISDAERNADLERQKARIEEERRKYR